MYYGRRYGIRKATAKKKKEASPVTTLTKLSRLSLQDLKKVQRAHEKYLERMSEVEWRNASVEKANSAAFAEFEVRDRAQQQAAERHRLTQIVPLERELHRLERSLEVHRVGFIGGLVGDTVPYNGCNYRKAAQSIIDNIERKWTQLNVAKEAAPRGLNVWLDVKREAGVKRPNDYVDITVAGVKTRIKFDRIDVDELGGLIKKLTEQQVKEKEKRQSDIRDLRARAAENEKKVRALSKHDRKELQEQLRALEVCPYCSSDLSENNAHKDHIYPVAKGGKSFRFNLVYVCTTCNMKKGETVLRNFLSSQGYDVDAVFKRLDALGKQF